jgi:hypothetical protein
MLISDAILLIVVVVLFLWIGYLNLPLGQAEYIRNNLDKIWKY